MSSEFQVGDVVAFYNPETKAGLILRIYSESDEMWMAEESSDRPRGRRKMRCWQLEKKRFIDDGTLIYRPPHTTSAPKGEHE